jgi:hypothetical protein
MVWEGAPLPPPVVPLPPTGRGAARVVSRFGAAALAILASLIIATTAVAHSPKLIKSIPAAAAVLEESPAEVMVQFDEELDTKGSTLKVFDTSERQVDQGNGRVDLNDADHATMRVGLPATLPAGEYTVRWHVVLGDGDATDGAFKFTVARSAAVANIAAGNPAPAPAQQSLSSLPANEPMNNVASWLIGGLTSMIVLGCVVVVYVLRRRSTKVNEHEEIREGRIGTTK